MGTRWVGGGVYRYQGPTRQAPTLTAKRAPEAPCRGAGVGGQGGCAHGSRYARTPPSGPGRPCRPPWVLPGLSGPASWPIRARFDLISQEYSKNGQVSPKSVEKASNSPYFQNGLRKSPLEILRIPFSLAFSHKELMGHFSRGSEFIVKMTKCRQ